MRYLVTFVIKREARLSMTTTLVVLAATMGHKYGGLKYLDGIGPNGETILDYSIYDAIQVGFNKVVFVISRYFEEEFRKKVSHKYEHAVEVSYVYQEVDDVPAEIRHPKRTLLWGSAHAVLCSRLAVDGPFGVINAVNFYQRESFQMLYDALHTLREQAWQGVMVGYKMRNVVPESGGANRGVCRVSADSFLQRVTDYPGVENVGGHPMYPGERNQWMALSEEDCVSMNMWGFTPELFEALSNDFDCFVAQSGGDVKKAYLLPDFINEEIERGARFKVLPTEAVWMALVSPDDKIQAVLRINDYMRKGVYPFRLFEQKD